MNRATSPTGWVRNPVMTSPDLDPTQASSYDLGWTFNPITGCLNHINGMCKGGNFPCYAYKLANTRLRERYLANNNFISLSDIEPKTGPFHPRFWPERLNELGFAHRGASKPKGIFVCDMSDLFGIGIPEGWTRGVLREIKQNNHYRFYLLTKQPHNLIKFNPFPDNCWVGVTATDSKMAWNAYAELKDICASVKYLSLEPLLEEIDTRMFHNFKGVIKWVIIGACTGSKTEMLKLIEQYPDLTLMPYGNKWTAQPKIEWVQEIVEACDKAGIAVFLKENLSDLIPINSPLRYGPAGELRLRQELPQ